MYCCCCWPTHSLSRWQVRRYTALLRHRILSDHEITANDTIILTFDAGDDHVEFRSRLLPEVRTLIQDDLRPQAVRNHSYLATLKWHR